MTEAEYAKKLEELDRQLNDPDIPMNPARVWALLADLRRDASGSDRALKGARPPGHSTPGPSKPGHAKSPHQGPGQGARPG